MQPIIKALIIGGLLSMPLAATVWQSTEVFKTTKTYGKDTNIGFELWNKGKKPLAITIRNADESLKPIDIQPGEKKQAQIDIQKKTYLSLLEDGAFINVFTFPKGKTVYLTWHSGDKYPRPQTGPLKGLLNKSDSGLSLAKNVTADDVFFTHYGFEVPANIRETSLTGKEKLNPLEKKIIDTLTEAVKKDWAQLKEEAAKRYRR